MRQSSISWTTDTIPVYGARPLKRFLQKHVETLSAKLILADEVREGDTILIDVEGDKLTARVK